MTEERNAYRDMARDERSDCFKLIDKIENLQSNLIIEPVNVNAMDYWWKRALAAENLLKQVRENKTVAVRMQDGKTIGTLGEAAREILDKPVTR